jgi:hypothetical protein
VLKSAFILTENNVEKSLIAFTSGQHTHVQIFVNTATALAVHFAAVFGMRRPGCSGLVDD